MQEHIETTLEEWVTGWNAVCDANRSAMGVGWRLSAQALDLHLRALNAHSVLLPSAPTPQQRAVLLTGIHSLRVFSEALGLVVRGKFDVAVYLFRPLHDAQSLLAGSSRDREFAERVLAGNEEHLPSEARRNVVVPHFRGRHFPNRVADWLDERFRSDATASDRLAHTGVPHLARTLDVSSGAGARPVVDGFVDASDALVLCAALLEQEQWVLTHLADITANDVSWQAEFGDLRNEINQYRTTAKDVMNEHEVTPK